MTSSVDKSQTGQKPVKKQGAIRVEAVVPMLIVVGLIVLYFSLFFDAHLRRGLEFGATQANGAEVNIGTLQTSVFNASMLIGDVQMTDPLQPHRNRVQIGEVRFGMLWDALLRGKVMIDEATVADVQIDTPRKRAGKVLPPPAPQSGPSASDRMMAKMKEAFSGNVVGDLAAIAAGANPAEQLQQIGGDLKSDAYMADLQKSMDETEQQWKARMAALPRGEDFSALRTRLANVQLKDFKDLQQVQASVKELQAIRDEFEAKSKPIAEAGSSLSGDLKGLQTSFSGLDDVVREDVRGLQARMKLPSLDAGNLSQALFGMDVLNKLQQARGYMDQARQYMPAKSKQATKPAPRNIHKGRDYAFGHPKGYPAFWLRRAIVTSTLPGGKGLSGEIRDAATDQALVGRPMIATLKGDFPQQGVAGIKAELVVDHTKPEPLERMELSVARYGVAGRSLVSSPNVTLGFAQATAAAGFTAELRGEQVAIQASNQFRDVAFETTAQSPVVREMMNASLSGLKTVSMDARVSGTWGDLDWDLSTNLGDALARGMKRYLQEKMDAARKRIQAQVDQRIAAQRQKLTARRGELESRLKSALADKQAQVDKLRNDLETARRDLEQRKNAATDEQKQKLKQEANKLLDKWRR
ncbi:MAG: TIGR03545 family protein [Gammaproteobacteria bacterium]|nr:TIGR03545 family protein [Gammaproteobacteria bacterium]